MFENYPKERIPLSEEFEKVYREQYRLNRDGATPASGLSQKMEQWLHKKVCADVPAVHDKKTLEIGAGTLNQMDYEESSHYDVIEPWKELYINSPHLGKVKNIYADIDEVDLSNRYDRITSVATFEHITDLPKVVAKSCLLLNPEGSLRTSIPNEGTIMWTLGWKLTTGLEFKLKHGLDYGELFKNEHVNTSDDVEEVLNYFFGENKCSVFGVHKKLAFYRFYESKKPNVERAKEYLESIAK